ncbi:hypothetical protein HPB47_004620 [Ixodes persulcatus]|uniref:Uncharacterized protein n=1 Tax=Ixodes persulcatus TaxID=34615 RepID=A0AC60PF69_IXOPE|nr:hypothetical protein HPB47_004620 [Ixodes persulcatus]
MVDAMAKAKEEVWENREGENLVVVYAGLNDVLKGRSQNLARQIELGLCKLREVSGTVHVQICTVPEVRGQSLQIEKRVVEANRVIKGITDDAFEALNCRLQAQAPQVHVLRSLLFGLLEELLSRFVRPGLLKEHNDLLGIDYKSRGAQRDDEDIVIGQEAKHIVDRLMPTLLPVKQQESKDKALNFLEMEFVKLQAFDIPPDVLQEERADVQWNTISHIKGADGLLKLVVSQQ